jgi:SAM-dependent methyltransferase
MGESRLQQELIHSNPNVTELYTSGEYLRRNPAWHAEESAWKADHIFKILQSNCLTPRTICEVGCGAGEVLRRLQLRLGAECKFYGYEISPQAFELCKTRANERLQFRLEHIEQDPSTHFDLILVLDVIEHLEDYFAFLRKLSSRSEYKILHIPLDLSLQTILRGAGLLNVRDWYGHIHYFTKDTALRTLKESGYAVLDWSYTGRAIEQPSCHFTRNLLKLPRKLLFAINKDLAARILGGWSLLVLAK